MKVAIVYTGVNPELITTIERELRAATKGIDFDIMTLADPTIINETIANGSVTPAAAQRLMKLYMAGMAGGADIIYNICSSIGDVADAAKPIFKMMGIPLVRIDENMAINAIKTGKRIGVLATLKTTLEPTKRLIKRCAHEMGTEVTLVDALADGAFGKSKEELEDIFVQKVKDISDKVDVILLSQASMAECEKKLEEASGKPVVSSPRFGAAAMKNVICSLMAKVH